MTQKLENHELALWIQFIFELTGISLNHEKEYLIRERLHSLIEKYRCGTYSHLYFLAREPARKNVREEIIDRITIKETSFFRDTAPFNALKTVILPELLRRARNSSRKLKIWSAACATGQEAYSIAMILREIGATPKEYSITATDISAQALRIAETGSYSKFEVERGIPANLLQRFFYPRADQYVIDESLKESLNFDRLELHQPFIMPEPFDLTICRNVAIYFSPKNREYLFYKIRQYLREEGYLLIGATESVRDLPGLFEEKRFDERTVFLKPIAGPVLKQF